MDSIDKVGVDAIEWVLHTHHHRDQCQGDTKLKSVQLAVPFFEAELFENVEAMWQTRQTYHRYDMRSTNFSSTINIRASKKLVDYEIFKWKSFEFEILPTPGHTEGSISISSRIDGNRVCFCGDLIYQNGLVWSLYDLQYEYEGLEALDVQINSVADILGRRFAVLLPSHGDPISSPNEALQTLFMRLSRLFRVASRTDVIPWRTPTDRGNITQISPHLLHYEGCSNTFIILSESGKALLVDYGYPSYSYFLGKKRFVKHTLDTLMNHYHIKDIDVVMPTHYHDDHVAGIPILQNEFETEIWCIEKIADVLEQPEAYNLPCLFHQGMKVNKKCTDNEEVEWEEYELKIVHLPGHTEYAMGILTIVDGQRIMFVGDNVYRNAVDPSSWRGGGPIFRNDFTPDGFAKCASTLINLQPDLILPGHESILRVTDKNLEEFLTWARELESATADLYETGFGIDPYWVRISPYRLRIRNGELVNAQVIVRNHYRDVQPIKVFLNVPERWTVKPSQREGRIGPSRTSVFPFEIFVPKETEKSRVILTASVSLGKRDFGQLAEMMIDSI